MGAARRLRLVRSAGDPVTPGPASDPERAGEALRIALHHANYAMRNSHDAEESDGPGDGSDGMVQRWSDC